MEIFNKFVCDFFNKMFQFKKNFFIDVLCCSIKILNIVNFLKKMFNMYQSWFYVILIYELKIKNVFNFVFYFCVYILLIKKDIFLKYLLNFF